MFSPTTKQNFESRSHAVPLEIRVSRLESNPEKSNDDKQLVRLGKKPVLKRNFGFMSILGFSCTVLITWEGGLIVAAEGLENGGTAGVIWGFLFVWIGTTSAFAAIGEMASMAPTSGGQYHWVSILAPPSSQKFLSYVTGWVTVIGWQAVNASNAFLNSGLVQVIAAFTHSSYTPKPWQQMLISWAILAFCVVVNAISSRVLARFEGAILMLHLFGFFAILIPLVVLGPHADASDVFGTLNNGGGWPSDGLSFLIGLSGTVFCLFGADSAVHMSEEIQNASMAVPQALMLTMGINGALGWAMLIALMFCIGSITDALNAEDTIGYPFIEIFQQAVGSTTGTAIMASIVAVMAICATVGTVAASTRLLWAFARDRGVPFSSLLTRLGAQSTLPINTIILTITISVLLNFIVLGSSVALNDILSLSVAGLYSSYLIVCILLFYRRIRGEIRPRNDNFAVTGPDSLHWGPWRIPEPLGTVNNAFACVYLTFMLFWSFWPPATPVTGKTMNFSVLVFGAVVLFSILWYFLRARKYFKGPIMEL